MTQAQRRTKMPAGMVNQQCHEAITAAQTAARAGTWVYTIAYGAGPLSGCSSDTNPTISPCAALQQMASDSTKFFSDQTGSNNACTSAAHPITGLNQIFQTKRRPNAGPANPPTPQSSEASWERQISALALFICQCRCRSLPTVDATRRHHEKFSVCSVSLWWPLFAFPQRYS